MLLQILALEQYPKVFAEPILKLAPDFTRTAHPNHQKIGDTAYHRFLKEANLSL